MGFPRKTSNEFTRLIQVWPQFKRFLLSVSVESKVDDTMTEFEALIGSEVERLARRFANTAVSRILDTAMHRIDKEPEYSVGELLRQLKESIDATIEHAND